MNNEFSAIIILVTNEQHARWETNPGYVNRESVKILAINCRTKTGTEQTDTPGNVDDIIEAVKRDPSNQVDHLFPYYYKETRPSEPFGRS